MNQFLDDKELFALFSNPAIARSLYCLRLTDDSGRLRWVHL
jgi:hypothetical protein